MKLLAALLLFSVPVSAQMVRLTGFVKSNFNKSPVPYATVKIQSQEIYTPSSADGYFEFNFPARTNYDSMIVTALGYKPKTVAVSGFRFQQEILLEQSTVEQSAIPIRPGKPITSRQVVERAITQIRNNYADTFRVEGYFRKTQKIDGKYVSFLDASVEISDDQFAKRSRKKLKESIRVLAMRKSLSYNGKGYHNWADSASNSSNWLARLLADNEVRNGEGLLANGNRYDSIGYINFNNKICYEIKVLRKASHFVMPASAGYVGYVRLVIDMDDYSIFRITDDEHTSEDAGKKQFSRETKINSQLSAGITGGIRIVEFRKVKGKLVLSYISEAFQVEDYKTKTGETVHTNNYVWELFVNKIYLKSETHPLPASSKERDVLKFANGNYDPIFWQSYNMIPFTSENIKAFQDLGEKMPIDEQFRKK